MSPLNRGPLLGPRVPPAGIRPPPPPRFGGRLPPPGLPPRMPPPPMSPVFGPMRQRLPPPPRPGGVSRPSGPMPLFGPRVRGMAPMVPPMGLRAAGPRGPPMRPWSRRGLPPQILPHMRPRFSIGNGNAKGKALNNMKKELELKKPWMTDEIRSEIQKKNKLYAKSKKNKDAKEWEEFKDLRNKVTRMIREAKNDYLAKHPEQAHLYPSDEEPYDQRDENYTSSEECESYYCELCDRDFSSEDDLVEHKKQHRVCGIAGCTFSAHPLLVEKHITMQHNSGLYDRMKNLTSPEDIDKWITERKKKYPTKANIELRKAEEIEKVQRGEIIKQKANFTQQKKQKSLRFQNRKRKMPRTTTQMWCDNVQEEKLYRGLKEFPGTLSLRKTELQEEDEFDHRIVDDECDKSVNFISDEEGTPVLLIEPVITASSLSTLVADYGSASDGSEPPEEVPIKRAKVEDDIEKDEVQNISEIVNNVKENKDVEQCSNITSQESSNTKDTTISQHKHKERNKLNQYSKDTEQRRIVEKKQPYTSQLLERLLSRSIQHERNLICQCIKYIVDNNFFD
ncbi:FMR1-interacting protein NUFIP1 isoform X2 [Megalopta genalis]|uniref:FMR1-interacting protein NUFIP1 isoform X2 n=1 Tax=Megalopta genalis TaxID=115081 RepID=UPI001442F8A0|nr:nuclear fragile X mental retardation-interacting protein 1-like isoform X2 [Megalopta genalis]